MERPNYDYERDDTVLIYWDMSQPPEIGRVVEVGGFNVLRLALGDTGRAYEFHFDYVRGNSKNHDRFRDVSGRKVFFRNTDERRKRI